ncbi:MAG: ATP-binding protein [Ferruginibacter sp.]
MLLSLRLKKLKDVSIAKKLYFIVGVMALLILLELFCLWFANHTLSSLRAFVGAEGLWSKAQKDAFFNLRKYNYTHDEKDFAEYKKFMEVPQGDHITRLELAKPDPDMNIAREGFIKGRVHPDDIDGMIQLIRRFHDNRYISKAMNIWAKGDTIISGIMPIADSLHAEILAKNSSHEKFEYWRTKIGMVNQELTVLEDQFSYTLGEGGRWLEGLVLKILISVAVTVEFTGLLLTLLVTRRFTRDLNAIKKATNKVIHGDLSARADVHAADEVGKVAQEVNQMTEQLIATNRELQQVAYIASHDLQQPLKTIAHYSTLLQVQYKQQLDPNSREYLHYITEATSRMQLLVRDLLDYSRIGSDKKLMQIDCNKELKYILEDMAENISDNDAQIHTGTLPVINGYFEIKLLFENLVSNALKFRKKGIPPVISITSQDHGTDWLFVVKDNGIGIDEKHYQRVFTIFQKLHPVAEYPGTGTGLAHCKKIVELHRGKIWIESAPENGSSFYFTIPKNMN